MWRWKRQALLKPEYQDWYPWVTPGVWYRVRWLMELILRQQRRVEPHWQLPSRVLSDDHFVFRGGSLLRREGRRRLSDLIHAR